MFVSNIAQFETNITVLEMPFPYQFWYLFPVYFMLQMNDASSSYFDAFHY